MLQFLNGSPQWNVKFVRAAHDWELEFFTLFFHQLYSIILKLDGVDKLCWNPSKKKLFDLRSFYNVFMPHHNNHFPRRCIWRSKVPLRVVFFAWLATLGKILILNNLRKRHIIVVD
jgi:hypothetical protein